MKEFELASMEQETEAMLRIHYLNKDNAVFTRTGAGFLSLKTEDKVYPRVHVVRMFPFTDSERFLSIRNEGEKFEEIGIIEDIDSMGEETAGMLREQLALRYFTPKITKVHNVKDEYGYAYWDVVTDSRPCRFTVQMGGKNISHLSETRVLILDIDENRYEIPDIMKLTAAERKKLDLFL